MPSARDAASWQTGENVASYNITTAQAEGLVFDSHVSSLAHSDLRLLSDAGHYNISQEAVGSISSFFPMTFAGPALLYNETNTPNNNSWALEWLLYDQWLWAVCAQRDASVLATE